MINLQYIFLTTLKNRIFIDYLVYYNYFILNLMVILGKEDSRSEVSSSQYSTFPFNLIGYI